MLTSKGKYAFTISDIPSVPHNKCILNIEKIMNLKLELPNYG